MPKQLTYQLDQPKENSACSGYMRLGDNKPTFISSHCPYSFLLLIELKYNFLVIVGALFLAVNNTQFVTVRAILVIISHYPDDNISYIEQIHNVHN